jgi:hypothetical protein
MQVTTLASSAIRFHMLVAQQNATSFSCSFCLPCVWILYSELRSSNFKAQQLHGMAWHEWRLTVQNVHDLNAGECKRKEKSGTIAQELPILVSCNKVIMMKKHCIDHCHFFLFGCPFPALVMSCVVGVQPITVHSSF